MLIIDIDRFEVNIAVCETKDRTMIEITTKKLSSKCKEGDCIELNDQGIYEVMENETIKRKQDIENRFKKLFK